MTENFIPYVNTDNDQHKIVFLVDNIHCASCIKLIENALHEEEDVEARINMSLKRLSITFTGDKSRINELAHKVIDLGYPVSIPQKNIENPNDYKKFLLKSLALSGFGMGNLMLLSVTLWSADGDIMGMATKDLFHWLSAIIALPIILLSGRPFFRSALNALKAGKTNMDVPISLAIILASTMSFVEVIQKGEYIYFDSALMLIFFLLIGRTLDEMARDKARSNAQQLLSRLQGTANCLENGTIKSYRLDELTPNMILRVTKGENIAADGVVISGQSEVDTSLITGETIPQYIHKDSKVFAGTTNLLESIDVKITKSTDNSLLSHIVKLMEKAEQSDSKFVRIADKAARLYTPVIHSLGLLTFLFWFFMMGMDWQPALMIAVTVLIITCPCALGLAVPIVQIIASGRLMKQGILLKSGDALEKLQKITVAIFDKTGTLTIGKPVLKSMDIPIKDLQMAASLACHSKHPLSQAITNHFTGDYLPIENVKEYPGKGLEGTFNGKIIRLGNRKWCGVNQDISNNIDLELCLNFDNHNVIFHFTDQLREDATDIIHQLKTNNIEVVLLSGDRQKIVKNIAETLDITEYYGELSPEDKCKKIQSLKDQGHHILMVGDGLNDAPSLALSDIAMSPSSAVDISQNSADIIFQGQKLEPIMTAYQTAQKSYILVKQNFALAILYNIIAIPMAVAGYVTPLIAALAMSGSSLLVMLNSFRLYKKDS